MKTIAVLLAVCAGLWANSPEDAAVLAIKAVRSVTNSGVAFRAYSDRVLEARVKADQASGVDPKLKMALDYYETASAAWSLRFSRDPQSYQRSLDIGAKLDSEQYRTCKAIQELAESLDAGYKKKPLQPDQHHAMMAQLLAQRPNLLWSCAADLIDSAKQTAP